MRPLHPRSTTSGEHADAVSRRLATLSAELSAVRGDAPAVHRHTQVRGLLDSDPTVRDFMDGRTTEIPEFYVNRIRNELGPLWDHLPDGALDHDALAYLKAEASGVHSQAPIAVAGRRG